MSFDFAADLMLGHWAETCHIATVERGTGYRNADFIKFWLEMALPRSASQNSSSLSAMSDDLVTYRTDRCENYL